MPTPLVTLALVSYQHAAFLRDSLSSVFAQDYDHLEIIVIDDASKDASPAMIRDFIRDNNITTWQLKLRNENRGFCNNLNDVLSVAKGEFLFVLAGDDCMAPDRISSLVRRAEEMSDAYAVVYSDCNIIDENNRQVYPSFIGHYSPKKIHLPEGDVLVDMTEWNFIPNTAVLMRISALKNIGGFDEKMMLEDYSTWLTLADRGYLFAAIR